MISNLSYTPVILYIFKKKNYNELVQLNQETNFFFLKLTEPLFPKKKTQHEVKYIYKIETNIRRDFKNSHSPSMLTEL